MAFEQSFISHFHHTYGHPDTCDLTNVSRQMQGSDVRLAIGCEICRYFVFVIFFFFDYCII